MMRRLLGAARRVSTAPARPFRVLGLQQVAIGGLDKARLSGLWEGLLGVPKIGRFVAEKENVDEDILLLGRGVAAVELDLMQPLDADKAPKVHLPPLNHIGLWVSLSPQRLFTVGCVEAGSGGGWARLRRARSPSAHRLRKRLPRLRGGSDALMPGSPGRPA